MVTGKRHTVQQGDSVFSVASREGVSWKQIWEHPKNAGLREKRKQPGILHPNDEIFIPEKELKEVSCATQARHRFQVDDSVLNFSLRLLKNGVARANVPFELDIDSGSIQGKTDDQGFVHARVSASTSRGILRLTDSGRVEIYQINFGHIDPGDEWSGIQQRLHNLGFACQVTRERDEQTLAALAAFRAQQSLNCSDSELITHLTSHHGS